VVHRLHRWWRWRLLLLLLLLLLLQNRLRLRCLDAVGGPDTILVRWGVLGRLMHRVVLGRLVYRGVLSGREMLRRRDMLLLQ
jgi:hypothetical protein